MSLTSVNNTVAIVSASVLFSSFEGPSEESLASEAGGYPIMHPGGPIPADTTNLQ